METLSEELWDVVISGTGLPQSLLALSLSRSGKKVLHIDKYSYYGGADAGLSLDEVIDWVNEVNAGHSEIFPQAEIYSNAASVPGTQQTLRSPRSYTLSLNPQIIYAQSKFLPSLVASQIHTQLDFLAVGSWYILRDGSMQKIPSSREDVFADDSLSMRDKRGLMKFLRYVLQEQEDADSGEDEDISMLQPTLTERFGVPSSFTAPVLALALSHLPAQSTRFSIATASIQQHMRSIGYFGQGFGAVVAKYAGNAEIAQVACRAGAVGGGAYLLGHGISTIAEMHLGNVDNSGSDAKLLSIGLSNGITVRTRHAVGCRDDFPSSLYLRSPAKDLLVTMTRSVTIVNSPLRQLFLQTSDNGPVPAAVIVLADDMPNDEAAAPVYLQIHSEDTGECPAGQCIIYASVQSEGFEARSRLEKSIQSLLLATDLQPTKDVLWSILYVSTATPTAESRVRDAGSLLEMPYRVHDIALDDRILNDVKLVWQKIMGEDTGNAEFMRFAEREQNDDVAADL